MKHKTCFFVVKEQKKWQELLNQALFKTFFHTLDWENFLERQFKWLRFERYIYKDQALLSLARCKVFGKEKLISHPFCEYGGPLPLVENIDFQQFRKDLFEKFKQALKINLHPNVARSDLATLRNSYFIEGLRQKNREQVWASFRKTLRHSKNKAQRVGLEIKKCADSKDLKELYKIYLKTCRNNQVPAYPLSFFDYFLSSPKVEIILARQGSRLIAGSVFLFYDGYVHYFLNASHRKYKDLCANHLILWHQLQKYLGKDYQVFDLGGTRAGSSLEIFKSGWGARKVPIFELSNLAPTRGLRESKLRKIWGLLPAWAIKKLSPYLLKYKI